MGTIYCGPFSAEIDQGTQYGHEGYAVQVLHDGAESGLWVRDFREYRAGCACGWRGMGVYPPTDAGEDAALDAWDAEHLHLLIDAVTYRKAVPVRVLLNLIAEARRDAAGLETPEGRLTDRAVGRFDVIDLLASRLEDLAVDQPDPAARTAGGAW